METMDRTIDRGPSTVIRDDRSDAEKKTHTVLVTMTDSFMSGWGAATGGASVASWACRPEDADTVERWVRSRGEAKRVRIVSRARSRPGVKHWHIYVVNLGHPSLGGAT